MGLDMYLYVRTKEEQTQIGYWRKFNALHNYICGTLKNKPDSNCEKLYLTLKQINNILDLCNQTKAILEPETIRETKMINGKISEEIKFTEYSQEIAEQVYSIFPPSSGFFWGSIDVDSYYYEDIIATIEIFEKAKKLKEEGNRVFYYSWW